MRKILILIILFSFNSHHIFSQGRVIRQARNQFEEDRFINAIETLQPLLRSKDFNVSANLIAGMSYLNLHDGAEKALELLSAITERYPLGKKPSRETIEAHFYMGQALHQLYRFDEALEIYNLLTKQVRSSQLFVHDAIQREINYCNNAKELMKSPVKFDIVSQGKALNSSYDEHSPVVALDESSIFFTSNRPDPEMKDEDGRYFENIYVSYWRDGAWTAAEKLDLPGLYYGHRATVSVSADGQVLNFYQNDGMIGNLYQTKYRFGEWTEPEAYPMPINSQFNETHASTSFDQNSIWFTSDRPGGYGGKDIYVSHKLPDGSWGQPINAGPNINTPYDEESPYLQSDGKTLYFSSEGHNSMGGFDIFMSELDENGEWGKPSNIGYPINTPGDDIFFMPTPDGQRVYYASRQLGGTGSTDIYLITFQSDDERSLAVMASHAFIENEEPAVGTVIRIYESESGVLQGIYRPNPLSGKFVAVLPAGKEYKMELELEGYQTHIEEFSIPVRDVYQTRYRAFYVSPISLKK